MAENKKAFILYTDLVHVVEKLVFKDRENNTNFSGELFYHVLQYVNDRNPIPIDFIIEMAFEPIKLQLKRDLQKYEVTRGKRSEAGKISAEVRKQNSTNSTHVESVKQTSTNSTVIDTVIETVIDNDILLKKETKSKKEKIIKIKFEESEIFETKKFAEKFGTWNRIKLRHYYESAVSYSKEGHRYVDWAGAIANWARKDDLQGKLKFDLEVKDNKNLPSAPPETIKYPKQK
jgi:hypothetical protein